MQSADALAGGVEARHVCGVRLGIDDDPAHRVVRGRRDLHRLT